jgi:hypothetical protein
MNINSIVARICAALVLLGTLLGAAQPQAAAGAAPVPQDGAATWGSGRLPGPQSVQLQVNPEPPVLTPERLEQLTEAGLLSQHRGPITASNGSMSAAAIPPMEPETPIDRVDAMSPGTMTIFANNSLAPATSANWLNSPSVADNGKLVFATYNYYAALSTDYGATWGFIDPSSLPVSVPDGDHNGFCCDQDVLYDSTLDMMFWVLRYSPDAEGNNLKLVVSRGQAGLASHSWYFYTLIPPASPPGLCSTYDDADWFDDPHLTTTDNYLYLITNIYDGSNNFKCSVSLRMLLDELSLGSELNYEFYSDSGFNFTGAQGGTDTLYFARHVSNTMLRVYVWPESSDAASVQPYDLSHDDYLTGVTYDCTVFGTTVNPCGLDDDRVRTGWVRRDLDQLGFMWDAPQGTDQKGSKPFPYVRTLVIDIPGMTVLDDDWAWSSEGAYFLPSAGVNGRGHVGGSVAFAGGTTSARHPSCHVWLYDEDTGSNWTFGDITNVTAATNDPPADAWGDFFRTRMSGFNPFQFIGTCYAIEGGVVTPRVVRFGRERDTYLPRRTDFEGDGRVDIGYFNAASGLWGVLQSSQDFSYSSPLYFNWGQTGDIIVPGDYDGDGKSDPTLRTPPAGGQSAAYIILQSSTGYDYGSTLVIPAGWPGLQDTPVPADYNGDGITDPAIWRGRNGAWIIPLSPSFNTYMFSMWGVSGDVPVAADVDGDGKPDLGFFRPSTGIWGFLQSYYEYSYAHALFFSWGSSTDTPVLADYDGDGLADPAFVTPPAGSESAAYRILRSSTNYDYNQTVTVPAGWPGLQDTPVPGDYDRDGKADAAIWRGNNGVWIIPKSSSGNTSYIFAAWGASGYQPLK